MSKLALSNAMAVALGLLAFSAMPVLAQTSPNTTGNAATTTNMANTASNKAPTGSLEKYHGLLRTSELNGANVYNGQGTVIGTIDDMLVGNDGKVQNVVISVGGFLGVGTHYVSVPFSQLQVQPSRSGHVGPATTNGMAGTAVMPGTTDTATPDLATRVNPAASPRVTTVPNTTATGAGMATTGTALNGRTAAANASGTQYFSVVLPGATKDSLTKMPEFRYRG